MREGAVVFAPVVVREGTPAGSGRALPPARAPTPGSSPKVVGGETTAGALARSLGTPGRPGGWGRRIAPGGDDRQPAGGGSRHRPGPPSIHRVPLVAKNRTQDSIC